MNPPNKSSNLNTTNINNHNNLDLTQHEQDLTQSPLHWTETETEDSDELSFHSAPLDAMNTMNDITMNDTMNTSITSTINNWTLGFCTVNFDLDIGPVIESIFPPPQQQQSVLSLTSLLSEEYWNSIKFNSLPDTTSHSVNSDYDTLFSFRLMTVDVIDSNTMDRNTTSNTSNTTCSNTTTSSTTTCSPLYGYVFFRRRKDGRIRRGYLQKSLVLLSQWPYPGLYLRVLSIVGPTFMDTLHPRGVESGEGDYFNGGGDTIGSNRSSSSSSSSSDWNECKVQAQWVLEGAWKTMIAWPPPPSSPSSLYNSNNHNNSNHNSSNSSSIQGAQLMELPFCGVLLQVEFPMLLRGNLYHGLLSNGMNNGNNGMNNGNNGVNNGSNGNNYNGMNHSYNGVYTVAQLVDTSLFALRHRRRKQGRNIGESRESRNTGERDGIDCRENRDNRGSRDNRDKRGSQKSGKGGMAQQLQQLQLNGAVNPSLSLSSSTSPSSKQHDNNIVSSSSSDPSKQHDNNILSPSSASPLSKQHDNHSLSPSSASPLSKQHDNYNVSSSTPHTVTLSPPVPTTTRSSISTATSTNNTKFITGMQMPSPFAAPKILPTLDQPIYAVEPLLASIPASLLFPGGFFAFTPSAAELHYRQSVLVHGGEGVTPVVTESSTSAASSSSSMSSSCFETPMTSEPTTMNTQRRPSSPSPLSSRSTHPTAIPHSIPHHYTDVHQLLTAPDPDVPGTSLGLLHRLYDNLDHLWTLWELLLFGEPLVILGQSQAVVSECVWWLKDLVHPVPFCGDFRPYFTIQDPSFPVLTALFGSHGRAGSANASGAGGGGSGAGSGVGTSRTNSVVSGFLSPSSTRTGDAQPSKTLRHAMSTPASPNNTQLSLNQMRSGAPATRSAASLLSAGTPTTPSGPSASAATRFRSYTHSTTSEVSSLSSSGSNMGTTTGNTSGGIGGGEGIGSGVQRSIILGVTNPFFGKAFEKWPHVLHVPSCTPVQLYHQQQQQLQQQQQQQGSPSHRHARHPSGGDSLKHLRSRTATDSQRDILLRGLGRDVLTPSSLSETGSESSEAERLRRASSSTSVASGDVPLSSSLPNEPKRPSSAISVRESSRSGTKSPSPTKPIPKSSIDLLAGLRTSYKPFLGKDKDVIKAIRDSYLNAFPPMDDGKKDKKSKDFVESLQTFFSLPKSSRSTVGSFKASKKTPRGHTLNESLRRHFVDMTERFLVPLNRYFATLTPAPPTIEGKQSSIAINEVDSLLYTPLPQASDFIVRPFNVAEFMNHIAAHGPPQLNFHSTISTTSTTAIPGPVKKKPWTEMYLKFVYSPNFLGWLQEHKYIAEEQARDQYFENILAGAGRCQSARMALDCFLHLWRELVWTGRDFVCCPDDRGRGSLFPPVPLKLPSGALLDRMEREAKRIWALMSQKERDAVIQGALDPVIDQEPGDIESMFPLLC